MNLALETHRKAFDHQYCEDIGLAKVDVGDSAYNMLADLEAKLISSDRNELLKTIDPDLVHLQMPDTCSELSTYTVRMYLDPGDDTGVFHFVCRGVDDSLVYTDAVKLRTITV